MIELTREEIMRISQTVTFLKYSKRVLAFTEYGVVMLASVLNRDQSETGRNIGFLR